MEEFKETLKDHEDRIRSLESRMIFKLSDKLSNLCDKLDSLDKSLKMASVTFIGSILSILIFIIELHLK